MRLRMGGYRDLLTVGEPRTASEELSFTAALEAIYERHNNVVPVMALGVLQMVSQAVRLLCHCETYVTSLTTSLSH